MRNISSVTRVGFVLLRAACILAIVTAAGCTKEVEVTACDGTGKAMVATDATGRERAD